jgi:S1-C subfamily serine protease
MMRFRQALGRLVLVALISVAGTLCGGCGPSARQRERSLQSLGLGDDDRHRLVESVLKSTLVLEDTYELDITHQGNSWRVTSKSSRGSAVVLTEDGYVLTAAHCVQGTVSFTFSDGSRIAGAARVVYRGTASDALRDVAVLKIEAKGLKPLAWADDNEVAAGVPVLSAGCCRVDAKQPATVVAGAIRQPVSQQGTTDGHPIRTISFNAPIGRGDSGGPLVTRAGRLIGVNSRIDLPTNVVQAVRPDPGWINDLINADRQAHPSTQPATDALRQPAAG